MSALIIWTWSGYETWGYLNQSITSFLLLTIVT